MMAVITKIKVVFLSLLVCALLLPLSGYSQEKAPDMATDILPTCSEINSDQPFFPGALIFTEASCCGESCDKSINLYYYYESCDGSSVVISKYTGQKGFETTLLPELLTLSLDSNKKATFDAQYSRKTLVVTLIDKSLRITVEEAEAK